MNKCKYRPQQEAVSTRFCSSFLAAGPHRSGRCFRTIAERENPKKNKLKKYKKPATERIDSGDNLLMDNILVIALISSGVSPQLCVCVCVCVVQLDSGTPEQWHVFVASSSTMHWHHIN